MRAINKDVHFVVVTSTQIDHYMLVPGMLHRQSLVSHANPQALKYSPIEEHNGAWVVQLVHLPPLVNSSASRTHELMKTHLVEIRHLRDVHEVDHSKVLDLVRDAVQSLVHGHALAVPVVPEAYDDDAVFLGLDRLVDVPARGEMGQEVGHRAKLSCSKTG